MSCYGSRSRLSAGIFVLVGISRFMPASEKTSVIIAGAGPVGLGLACELGLRGVDCVLTEKRDGAITVPKQSMVSARNMEFCRRWGVAAAVRSAVWPESHPRDFIYLANMRGRASSCG